MRINLGLILAVCVFGVAAAAFAEDNIIITTYYPSPYGSYNDLTAYRMKIGQTYSQSSTSVDTNDLIVEGNIGIGTTSPNQKLQVVGNVNVTQKRY